MQGLGLPVSLFSWLAFCTYNNSNDKKPQQNPLQNVALAADRILAEISVACLVFLLVGSAGL